MPDTEASAGSYFLHPNPESLNTRRESFRHNCCVMRSSELAKSDLWSRLAKIRYNPPSLDLRLGNIAHRVRASFLPGPDQTVTEKLRTLSLHTLDLREGAVLEKDCVYIVPLQEYLALRYRTSGSTNPKSSTGRLNVFARVITDYGTEFDTIKSNYSGPLYAELSPRSFAILIRKGSRLVQLRVRRGRPTSSNAALRRLHEEVGFDIVPPGIQ